MGMRRGPSRSGVRWGRRAAAGLVAVLALAMAVGGAGGRQQPGATAGAPTPAAPAAERHAGQDHHADGAGDGDGDATPTAAEQAAAERLVRDTAAGAARFADVAVAEAAGYVQLTPFWFGGIRATHFIGVPAVGHDRVLDPNLPEGLLYLKAADGRLVLLGAMFLAPVGAWPRVGGPLTEWHLHPELCAARGAIVPVLASGRCPAGSRDIPLEMMHVWLVPNRLGPLAHVLPSEDAAAASDQTVDEVRPVPLVPDAALQGAAAGALRLTPEEVGRRFAARQSLAEMAAALGVERHALLAALSDAVAAALDEAVAVSDLPVQAQVPIQAALDAQIDLLLDLHVDEVDPASATTEFAYPCRQVSCLVLDAAAPSGHDGH